VVAVEDLGVAVEGLGVAVEGEAAIKTKVHLQVGCWLGCSKQLIGSLNFFFLIPHSILTFNFSFCRGCGSGVISASMRGRSCL
jgi:hypothetical protein